MKNRIRKMMCILLASVMVMSLAGCGASGSQSSGSQQAEPAEEPAEEPAAAEPEAPAETAPAETAPAETTPAQEPAPAETPQAEAAPADDWSVTALENGGYTLLVPDKYKDALIIELPQDDENGVLFDVYEKESVESAKKIGEYYDGAGWLFGIGRVSEEKAKEFVENDIPGVDVFAVDGEGNYFVYNHPTDVRVIREEDRYGEETMRIWRILNTWAMTNRGDFILNNEGLTPVNMSLYAEDSINGTLSQYFYTVIDLERGTAGSSLSFAYAAQSVIYMAAYGDLDTADHDLLREAMLNTWNSLTDENRTAFDENFMDIVTLIDRCQEDWEGNRGAFDDTDCGEDMEILLHSPHAMAAWDTLKANTLTLGNSEN